MAASLKHELRTPLNHIIGYCELLLEEGEEQALRQYARDLRRIHQAGKRLLTVINDLFDPDKSEGYRTDQDRLQHEVRTPLNQIIGYAEMLQEEAQEQRQEALVADLQKILTAARVLLHRVVDNLDGGLDQIAVSPQVEAGGVTTFVRREGAESGQLAAAGTPLRAEGRILVADDDPDNRAMLLRRLERLGYEVAFAEDGGAALDALQRERFDLLLLDIKMPVLDGYQVLERLKADARLQDIPVIVLSASDETERVARCVQMGAEDYLPKPFDPVLLQARISASLEKKRLRDREISYLQQIQEEKQRSDDLLHTILPRDVAAELKSTRMVKPRRFEDVAVLFCDIVGFTGWCDRHSPEEVLLYLQALVQEFERLTSEHGLEKIKTIGDAFMATAGMLVAAANPALVAVRCGLDMIAAARRLPPHWEIRVGVHAGPVIAGVVGRRKYQYDVWGDTVNTAMRMVQAGAPGAVCVNAQTWPRLADHLAGQSQGRIAIKGKGEQELICVTGRVDGA